ncbi:phosphotransferase enzyme family protein [Cohnella sp.]|uniref:phosphotransferase enzyme family protein n=1 Tax=Cohnella sp. TaxID=1883426 RepID=UPI003567CE18
MPFDQVLQRYGIKEGWQLIQGQSGWNNTTRFVETGGQRWVLRIYETHRDADKIRFEHEILLALNELELPFRIPLPARCDDGSTLVQLTDGSQRWACLFTYIKGHRPEENDTSIVKSIGRATGQLSNALGQLKLKSKPIYPAYYEMDSAHPLCAPEKVASFCSIPPSEFHGEAGELQVIGEAIESFRAQLPQFRELPHQLIHGDINHSNLLISDDDTGSGIAAVLDFEFCTHDLRVMELAVIMSGLLSSEQAMDSIEAFLSGAGEQLQLERREVEVIPLLVELRILDVFLHFLGRYLDGVDGDSVLREQTLSAYDGLKQLNKLKDGLLKLSFRHLTT